VPWLARCDQQTKLRAHIQMGQQAVARGKRVPAYAKKAIQKSALASSLLAAAAKQQKKKRQKKKGKKHAVLQEAAGEEVAEAFASPAPALPGRSRRSGRH
jgi:cell pole-organizing protein PopZ